MPILFVNKKKQNDLKTLVCEFSWKSEIFGYPMKNSETWLELVNYHRDYLCNIFCRKIKIWWNIKTKVTKGVFLLICRSNAYNTSKIVFHVVCCAHSGSTLGIACFVSPKLARWVYVPAPLHLDQNCLACVCLLYVHVFTKK